MADWFKFYENDLDEIRLRYAVSKLPEVIPVWVGILSEACRHKSETVSWGSDAIELFGFSSRLNVSIPKVNEAISLLVEIRYITKTDTHITVTKWHEKQSEYCQKRTKRQNQTGDQNPNSKPVIPTMSRQCPDSVGQEERRGEERRVPPLTPPVVGDLKDTSSKTKASEVEVLKQRLGKLFNRPVGSAWSYVEDHALADILQRQWTPELEAIEQFNRKLKAEDRRYQWPKTLARLLEGWTETLDKARTYDPKANGHARPAVDLSRPARGNL